MKQPPVAAGIYLLVTVIAVRWLWDFWTPLCNEACPSSIIIFIYLTLAFALLGGIGIFTLTALGKLTAMRSRYSYWFVTVAVIGCSAILTFILRSRGIS